jgi:hypothetical protein
MAVVSVEVPDKIAKKFVSCDVIPMDDLYDEIDTAWDRVVDFGPQGISAGELLSYLDSQK